MAQSRSSYSRRSYSSPSCPDARSSCARFPGLASRRGAAAGLLFCRVPEASTTGAGTQLAMPPRKTSKETPMQFSTRLACSLGVALIAAFAAGGQADEHAFIKEAVQGNLAEVQLGELAAQRADSEAVRKFGETLRTDHQAA